ncbi:MAG: glycosyltransferase family 1 protein [bacterium]
MKKIMRIAIDVRPAIQNAAGIGRYTRNLLKALSSMDKVNSYTLLSEPFSSLPMPLGANFHYHQLYKKGISWHMQAMREIVKENVDLYFSPSSLLVPSFASSPTAVMIHDLSALKFPHFHQRKTRVMERLLMKRALQRSKLLLTPAESTREELISGFGLEPDKVVVIPHGVESSFHPRPVNEWSGFSSDLVKEHSEVSMLKRGDYFLFVGTLEPRKNLTALLRGFHEYRSKGGKKKLVIVGKKGWFFAPIFRLYHALKLQDDVLFLHHISSEHLCGFYAFAFAFLYPSYYEGFGLPLLEAMASGCPVVSSNTSSMPEVVGAAGLLVDPLSSDELCSAMFKLEGSPALYERFRKEVVLRASTFTWEKTAEKTLEAFRKVVGN